MKKLQLNSILAVVAMTASLSTAMAEAQCDAQELIDLGAGVHGKATMCVTSGGVNPGYPDRGLIGEVRAKGLMPRDAYTVWWVYFDDPSLCVDPGNCGPADFEGDDPLGVFGRFGSLVAPASGYGKLEGAVSGMKPSSGSNVWLLMFGHGPADFQDGRQLARQLLTPEDPLAGAPHLGIVGGPLGTPVALAVYAVN